MTDLSTQTDTKLNAWLQDLDARADLAALRAEREMDEDHLRAFRFGKSVQKIEDDRIICGLRADNDTLRTNRLLSSVLFMFLGLLEGLVIVGLLTFYLMRMRG